MQQAQTYIYRIAATVIESDIPLLKDYPTVHPVTNPDIYITTDAVNRLCISPSEHGPLVAMGNDPDPGLKTYVYQIPDGYVVYAPSVGSFFVDDRGRRIAAHSQVDKSSFETVSYILTMVLPFAFELRGLFCLHASAIVAKCGAIAFLGHSGVGKSTLTAEYLRAGYTMITDDVLPIQVGSNVMNALPGIPRIGMHPDTQNQFLTREWGFVDADKSKKWIGVHETVVASKAWPLKAACLLDPQTTYDDSNLELSPLNQSNAFELFSRQRYGPSPTEPCRQQEIFLRTIAIAKHVPCWRLRYRRDYAALALIPSFIDGHLAEEARL